MANFHRYLTCFLLLMYVFALSSSEYRGFTYKRGDSSEDLDEDCPDRTTLNDVVGRLTCARFCAQQNCEMLSYESDDQLCHLYGKMTECVQDDRVYHKEIEFHNLATNVSCSTLYRGEFCQRSLFDLGEQLPMDEYYDGNVSMISGREVNGIVHQAASLTTDAKVDKALKLAGGFVDFGPMTGRCIQNWDQPDCDHSFSISFLMKVTQIPPPTGGSHYIFSIGRVDEDVDYAISFTINAGSPGSFDPKFYIRHQGKYYRISKFTSEPSRSTNTWEHYALVLEGTTNGLVKASILINGVEVGSGNTDLFNYVVDNSRGPSPLVFGAKSGDTSDMDSRAHAIIDDFFMFGGDPDMAELQDLYKTPNYGLVGPQ